MKELLGYFLSLGFLGFGGPLAVIARIQNELVEKRKWISELEFRNAFAMIKSMPGPVAFQMVVFMGYKRMGRLGGLLAGFVYVLPSFVMMIALAEFLSKYQQVEWINGVLKGLACASFVLIAVAARSLLKGNHKKISFWMLVVFSIVGLALHLPEPVIILLAGASQFLRWKIQDAKTKMMSVLPLEIFLLCFKAGAFVFGTGLAIMPIIQRDFVDVKHWISSAEFLTAISLGQITPGPVVIAVVYVGYKILGMTGAIVAALGVFLPSLFHMLTWFPKTLDVLQKQKWIDSVSSAVVAAVFATMVVVLFNIGLGFQPLQIAAAVALGILALLFSASGISLVAVGAIIGFFL